MHVETERQKVLYSKHLVTSQKCPYHVIFDLDLNLEHTVDAGSSGDHRVQVWSRSSHVCGRSSDFRVVRKALHYVHRAVKMHTALVSEGKQESPAVADKPARRLRKVCTVHVRAVGLL